MTDFRYLLEGRSHSQAQIPQTDCDEEPMGAHIYSHGGLNDRSKIGKAPFWRSGASRYFWSKSRLKWYTITPVT